MALFERPTPQMGTNGDVLLARLGAAVVDIVLIGAVGGVLAATLRLDPGSLGGATGLLALAYFLAFEGASGQTPGKNLFGLVVVTDRGEPCGFREAAIRTLLRLIDALPVFYLVGVLAILLTDEQQRLGDLAADTVVVRAAARGERL
jgi:uncharacterized RDD family membrane protein YckC